MILLFTGDRFLVGRALKQFLEERVPAAARDFNCDQFDGAEAPAARILETARALPMLAPRRAVVVREAERLRKGEMERLEAALAQIPETTDLVFVAEKVDGRLRFWQALKKAAKLRDLPAPGPREAEAWLREEARQKGIRLAPDAGAVLLQSIGSDPGSLAAALEKLSLATGGKEEIGVEAVTSCVSGLSWREVFELTEAAGERDFPRAVRLLHSMAAGGESLVALTALLARHFRILRRIQEKGHDPSVPPYYLKNYQRQAGRFSKGALEDSMERIFRTDWILKSSPLPPMVAMESLLKELCG